MTASEHDTAILTALVVLDCPATLCCERSVRCRECCHAASRKHCHSRQAARAQRIAQMFRPPSVRVRKQNESADGQQYCPPSCSWQVPLGHRHQHVIQVQQGHPTHNAPRVTMGSCWVIDPSGPSPFCFSMLHMCFHQTGSKTCLSCLRQSPKTPPSRRRPQLHGP